MEEPILTGIPAVLAFLGAMLAVGAIMWAGATGRIGNGKRPMSPPGWWSDGTPKSD